MEDYERNYKEALKKAEGIIKYYKGCNRDEASIENLETIFPELKESEDERIRKALVRFHGSTIDIDGIKGSDIVAWLEKQKVLSIEEDMQGREDVLWCIKQAQKYAKDENEMGTCWFAEKWIEKQGEKPQRMISAEAKEALYDKPAWSEEDETKLTNTIIMLKEGASQHFTNSSIVPCVDWLKSLKERIKG